MLRLLKEYENYGDVVEGIYDILHIFVQISKALGVDSGDALVSMLDGNKELLGIAIKHTSIYDCEHAYTFLHDLIRASKRYQKGRLRLEKELSYLKPPMTLA